jgi:hypothetical protein
MKNYIVILGLSLASLFAACGNAGEKQENASIQDTAATEMPVVGELITENFAASYKGTINGKYAITLDLNKFKDELGGSYKYEGKNTSLVLSGRMDDTGSFTFNEYTSNGKATGTFEGKLKGEELSGTWYNSDRTKQMPFLLKRTAISSLQSKTDVLSDAIGQYTLSSIAGNLSVNGIFDTYYDEGKWKCSSSGIISSQRVVQEIELTDNDIQFLNNLHIEVDDELNVHIFAGLHELVNSKFNASEMDYRINEMDKMKMNPKIANLSPSTIYQDNQLVIAANDQIDFSEHSKEVLM